MNAVPSLREKLLAEPYHVLAKLPVMGRVMIVAHHGGATHERLGVVDTVLNVDHWAFCRGATHDSEIDMGLIAWIAVDRGNSMNNTVLPHLEFFGADDTALFRVVGLEGLEKFDAGLSGIASEPLPPLAAATKDDKPQIADDDPGAMPFNAAIAAHTDVTIELRKLGITQRWRGVVEQVRPAMGFINVMTKDFHLHLRGGAVATWRATPAGADGVTEMHAMDGKGNLTGLVVRGKTPAFDALN
jgi:putative heme degradation protein